jgi:hypothetical protein
MFHCLLKYSQMTILEHIKQNSTSLDIANIATYILANLNNKAKVSLFLEGLEGSILCKNLLKDRLEHPLRQAILQYLQDNYYDLKIESLKEFLSQEIFKYSNNKPYSEINPQYLGTAMSYQRFKRHLEMV